MNLSFENHCVSNSPSKLEGVGGSMSPHLQLFIFVELTLNYSATVHYIPAIAGFLTPQGATF